MTTYITKPAYFRSNPKFGRTTQLINKATGNVVFEGMGVCTKADLIKSMERSNVRPVKVDQQFIDLYTDACGNCYSDADPGL